MKAQKGFTLIELIATVVIVGILGSVGFGGVWGYLNSETVTGRLESVTPAFQGAYATSDSAAFSTAIMLKRSDGTLITFSSEDRQWMSVADKKFAGHCVTAKIFPYSPLNFSKAGTHHNGRLLGLPEKC